MHSGHLLEHPVILGFQIGEVNALKAFADLAPADGQLQPADFPQPLLRRRAQLIQGLVHLDRISAFIDQDRLRAAAFVDEAVGGLLQQAR
ncbi:hypothetical protein D3C73_1400340 [compost metagenome]